MHIFLIDAGRGKRSWGRIFCRKWHTAPFPPMSSSFQTDSTMQRIKVIYTHSAVRRLNFSYLSHPAETCFVVTVCISRPREQLFSWIISGMDCVRRSLYRHRYNKGLTPSFSHAIIIPLFSVTVSLFFIRFKAIPHQNGPLQNKKTNKKQTWSASISCIEFFYTWIYTSW